MEKRLKWSEEEDQILVQYYINNGPDFCIQFLNRTKFAIIHRAKSLNLYMTTFIRGQKNRKYTKEVLEPIIKQSVSYADLLRNLGVQAQAANFTNIKKRIIEYNIDVTHFKSAGEITSLRNKNRTTFFTKKLTTDYLIENSTIDNQSLKKRLFDEKLKKRICEMCGQDEIWQGKRISLILDHINGINNDNTLNNLRILCPNCNATLDTHCSKNRKIKERNIKKLITEKQKRKKTPEQNKKYRKPHIKKSRPRKVELPSLELLTEMVKNYSYVEVGRRFGVSDNAIRKWFKHYGVNPPKKSK